MGKPNIKALKAPKRHFEHRVFTDPDHPDKEFPFTLGTRNFVIAAKAQQYQKELVETYVEPGNCLPIERDDDDDPVYADETMCEAAGIICALQGGPEDDRYEADELLFMEVVAPRAFEQAMALAGQMANGKDADPGNASRAATVH